MQPKPADQTTAAASPYFYNFLRFRAEQLARRWLQIQLDRLANVLQCLAPGFSLRPAAFQCRAMCHEIAVLSAVEDDLDLHIKIVTNYRQPVN
jgi:hypothetical protein